MNANGYFNNQTRTPRAFDNANQWAASLGGPIRKNKTFLFVNTEGLRVLLPTSTKVNVPSPQFEAATLANLAAKPSTTVSIPFYVRLFSLCYNAAGANRAQNTLFPRVSTTPTLLNHLTLHSHVPSPHLSTATL